ncbi:MAG: glucosamine-6-phosphate deaminase [Candidatus Latescibacteria bacterium]|nr:glucosamine-6-phosphate deaminase [Candidatus Latescibacterota bacterium]
MRVIIEKDYEAISGKAAEFVAEIVRNKPDCVLGLATGSTPIGLYKELIRMHKDEGLDFSHVTTFNLDEYVGLPGENAQQRALHPESYSYFMIENLFRLLEKKPIETNVPWGTLIEQTILVKELKANPEGWKAEGTSKGKAIVIRKDTSSAYLNWVRREVLEAYPRKMRKMGGVDLQIIGVGGVGHVAFHEAGIPLNLKGLILVELDRVTREHAVADGHFESLKKSPRYAISMSCDLVFQAKSVLLVANGPRKTEAVARAVLEKTSADVPLSYSQKYVQKGGELTWVLDEAASTDLLAERKALKAKGIPLKDLRAK